jgi:hypothetical protein
MTTIALIFASSALFADERINNDTLIIKFESGSQIKIVCFDFNKLKDYSKADSLMQLFYVDYEKSLVGLSEADYPKEIHYLIADNGKRRMKMQDPDFAEGFDLAKESYKINEGLSSIHFVIYDLKSKVQIHLYPQSYGEISMMKSISLNAAVAKLKDEKKDLKRNYLFALNNKNSRFEKIKLESNSNDQIEIHADVNTLLIGNQWTPAIGMEARFMFLNRFNKPNWSVGLVWCSYGFSDFKDGQFKNFTYNTGVDARLMFNLNQYGKEVNWLGLEFGLILPTKNETPALSGTSYKFMVHNTYNGFGYSFGSITDGNRNWLPVVGFKLPF